MDSFDILRPLGNSGLISLCKFKADGATYVVKRNCDRDDVSHQQRLRHENLVRLHAAFEDRQSLHCVYEYVASGSIADLVASSVNAIRLHSCIDGVLRALAYIHSTGEAHRNVRPQSAYASAAQMCL